jgi:4'-phosphopantetheinyl transferase
MQIEANEIHIFTADLDLLGNTDFALLSADESERALRFHSPLHRQRFIAARSLLRSILSLYVNTPAHEIIFAHQEKKKPYLKSPAGTCLQFNLAHSEQMAVYALTMKHAIGVDIEKIRQDYPDNVAERFFNPKEYDDLQQLSADKRPEHFYRVWARKEAIVKAIGKGLSMPLASFSVSIKDDFESVMIDNETWALLPLTLDPRFQAAAATNQQVKRITYWKFVDQSPACEKVDNL